MLFIHMAKLVNTLYVIVIIVFCAGCMQFLQKRIEGFVDDYKVIAMNAFPCKPPGLDMANNTGCYYTELNGCAVFQSRPDIKECPITSKELKASLQTPPAIVAQNEDVFDYVYDALKEKSPPTDSCRGSPPCSFDFFKKLALMTDGELDAYKVRIQKDPCSIGGICMLPENIAAYIGDSQHRAAQKKAGCPEAQKAYHIAKNATSKDIINRTFPDCSLAVKT